MKKKENLVKKYAIEQKSPGAPCHQAVLSYICPFKRFFIVIGWLIVIVEHMLTDRNLKVR